MPNYYNSYGYPNNVPMSYGNGQYQSAPAPQYSQPQYQQQVNPTMIWVDGEAAARAYQIPPTHPIGQPIALWDNNDMVIYLKSIDSFGRPAPLKKIRYTVEAEQQSQQMSALPGGNGNSGNDGFSGSTENYVTKDDLESLKNEIRTMMQQNQNGGNNGGNNNRGGKQ